MKKAKKLTRLQAWRKIKRAFKGFKSGCPLTKHGLCFAVRTLIRRDALTLPTWRAMERDIRLMRPNGSLNAYYWPTRRCHLLKLAREGAAARVEAITKLLKKKS